MATVLLQVAGAALGGMFGGFGAALGSAAGAAVGYAVDRALIDSTRRIEGPRLSHMGAFAAEDGAPLPRIYGAARVPGVLIWATRHEEMRQTARQGGKGGPKVTTYSYFANAAFALCEGRIAGIRRVWADGEEMDLADLTLRVHDGAEDQLVDPLILAKQGEDNAPAYRGTAYVVFERLPIGPFGNRLPQIHFEVLRPVGRLTHGTRAVALIPGSTEYGLSPGEIVRTPRPGEREAVNRHVLHADSDFNASVDELQALCPNLTHVALVVAWFGDDLRAGECLVRPGVAQPDPAGYSVAWSVAGLTRASAHLVSTHQGGSAYGGTPSDRSVIDAIVDLKARGLGVTLYPFVMMDIPEGNDLPSPDGGIGQPAYPWRGRIGCHPAPGQAGTADGTAAGRMQVDAFFGDASAADFAMAGGLPVFSGDAGEWRYRRFVLHCAALALAAGGVDGFLLGSELRGLTTVRDEAGLYPAVEQLCGLAADVRGMLGPSTKISYGADWSEYFGHQPADGSGDVRFHLDPLWAHEAIDAVGIDNYMPLSDWRDADHFGGNPDGMSAPFDRAALGAAIAGGEGHDWYYASQADRRNRVRSAITDGAYGKPWVFRNKDLVAWWSSPHVERFGGVEAAEPTAWTPRSKPIWFTELGCPAVDKGPNQPNVFPDAKSAEGAAPHFSNGGRSDLAQRRFIEAHLDRWLPEGAGFEDAANPVSPLYGGRMVDGERIYLWAWDLRPFPAFPTLAATWSDARNWPVGHWLNGRLCGVDAGELVNAILADHGLPPADAEAADGVLQGYVVSEPGSPRQAIEPLLALFGLQAFEQPDGLVVRSLSRAVAPTACGEIAKPGDEPAVTLSRDPDHDLPDEALLAYRDPFLAYQAATARAVREGATHRRQELVAAPAALDPTLADQLVVDWLKRRDGGRERCDFALAPNRRDLHPGMAIEPPPGAPKRRFVIEAIEAGILQRITARAADLSIPARQAPLVADHGAAKPGHSPKPLVHFMDLPTLPGTTGAGLLVAAWSRPWKTQIVFASPETEGYAQRTTIATPAIAGQLAEGLPPGAVGRLDVASSLIVDLSGGACASVSPLQLLNGGNAAALLAANGQWEILQFRDAEEVAPGRWMLRGLLRGQFGTEDATLSSVPAGAPFVLLDAAVVDAGLLPGEAGLPLSWRTGPDGAVFGEDRFDTRIVTGGVRSLLPLAPVHLGAKRQASGDLAVAWIRRGRRDADRWDGADIPIGEETERYLVEVRAAGSDAVLRSATVSEPSWAYGAALIGTDFPGGAGLAEITVRQLATGGGPGLPATRAFALA